MEPQDGGAQINIPHASETSFTVTPADQGRIVTLWTPDDQPVHVPETQANTLVRLGLRREFADVEAEAKAADGLFTEAKRAFKEYVASVVKDGHIDTMDEAAHVVAQRALSELTTAIQRVNTAIVHRYAVKQDAETVELVDWQGRTQQVDAKSAEDFKSMGWKETEK
jgi:hypothetical protein